MTATGTSSFTSLACDSGSLEELLDGATLSCPCCNGQLTSEKLARLFEDVQRLAQVAEARLSKADSSVRAAIFELLEVRVQVIDDRGEASLRARIKQAVAEALEQAEAAAAPDPRTAFDHVYAGVRMPDFHDRLRQPVGRRPIA